MPTAHRVWNGGQHSTIARKTVLGKHRQLEQPASFQAYMSRPFQRGIRPPRQIKIAELEKASKKTVVAVAHTQSLQGETAIQTVVDDKTRDRDRSAKIPMDKQVCRAAQLTGQKGRPTPSPTARYFPAARVRKAQESPEVEPLNCHKLWIARNEIDYRNGLLFQKRKGHPLFRQFQLHNPKVKLTSLEHRNKRTIRTWEIRKRCRVKKIIKRIKVKRPTRYQAILYGQKHPVARKKTVRTTRKTVKPKTSSKSSVRKTT